MKKIKIWFFVLGIVFSIGLITVAEDPKVVIDPVNKKIIVQSWDQRFSVDNLPTGTEISDQPISSWAEQPKPSEEIIPEKLNPLTMELSSGDEMDKALYRMFNNGLTKYDTLSGYRPDDQLLREEAAKIIGQAYDLLGFEKEIKNTDCSFSDSESFDPSLAPFIASTCSYWVFKGNDGKFLPQKSLTKAEALTVLIRILEGKSSSQAFEPWWTVYFIKAKEISLTEETEVLSLDRPITRREIALLIYRFKTLVLNQDLYSAAKSQLWAIETNPDSFLSWSVAVDSWSLSWTTNQSPLSNNELLGIVAWTGASNTSSLSILNSPEVNEAIQRMSDHGLTSAKTIATYQPFEPLTREQSAKMFAQFAKTLNFSALSWVASQCDFSDLNLSDSSLRNSINEVCKLGLMQWNGWLFSPKIALTKSQFITMLIRLSEGKRLDETQNPRWIAYFQRAKELWILNNEDALTFDAPLTRYEAALLFYRFQLKQKITSHLNTETLKNELISTRKASDWNFASGDNEGSFAIALDVNLLKNQFFQDGFVELLGTRYQLKKTTMTVFDIGEESFVWYWDLIDMQKDQKIWTINFVVSNGNVIQGTIRLPAENTTWLIKESKTTTAWFNLIKG